VAGDFGARIAACAYHQIGVKFRLHGRTCESGFDCVGLLADALMSVGFHKDIPESYSLRGHFSDTALAYFDGVQFAKISPGEAKKSGDFALVQMGPRQLHLVILADDGFVHAHAGLRRVVLTPGPVPWPIIGHWRFIGD
jgi:murein DD-endopeptidase / murein LD-carboxypeptidase